MGHPSEKGQSIELPLRKPESYPINSREWWENYFAQYWEANKGSEQTRHHMELILANTPIPEMAYIRSRSLRILDWGCAFGEGADLLAQFFPSSAVFGLDFAQKAIEEARRRHPHIEFILTEHGEIPSEFDVIVTSHTLEHFENPLKKAKEHLLSCKDLYILLVPYDEYPLPEYHRSQFREESFPERLENFLRIHIQVIPDVKYGKQLLVIYGSDAYLQKRAIMDLEAQAEQLKWDRYYASLPLLEEDEATKKFNIEFAKVVEKLLPAGSCILEAGCGAGWQSLSLARLKKYKISLMDFSREALRYARRIFEREKLEAEFIQEDVFSQGEPKYDLVFNAGVLEHYTFDKQVAFLKGMASRSRKYVMVLVPNQLCYWYWLWRIQKSGEGGWPFGKEIPLIDLSTVFKAAGIQFLGQMFIGESWTESFISGLTGLDERVRQHILEIHRSPLIPKSQKSYLVAALGSVTREVLEVPAGWADVSQPKGQRIAEICAALADALGLRISAEWQLRALQARVLDLEQTVAKLMAEQERLQQRLGWKRYRLADCVVGWGWRLTSPMRGCFSFSRARRLVLKSVKALLRRVLRLLPLRVQARILKARYQINTFISRFQNLKQYRQELVAILKASKSIKGVIIYPPTLDWNFMFQRPQQLARALARQGFLFFFCTPNSRVDQVQGFEKVGPNLYVCHVPWQVFDKIQSPILLVSWAVHHSLIDGLKDPVVIYDCVDDLEVGGVSERDHNEMLQRADLVLATARKLYDSIRLKRPDVLLCPNAVDYDTFVRARSRAGALPPADLTEIVKSRKMIVGYHGALARWFDYSLLAEVAAMSSEAVFVLIGCDYDGTLTKSRVLELDNVVWLGMKPYEELVNYVRWFDVGIIPFKLNNITEACSPIKLWEYLAAGKPVVSTELPMCRGVEGVLIARSAEDFASKILEAAELGKNEEVQRRIDEVVRRETWDTRAAMITSALEELKLKTPMEYKKLRRRKVARPVKPG